MHESVGRSCRGLVRTAQLLWFRFNTVLTIVRRSPQTSINCFPAPALLFIVKTLPESSLTTIRKAGIAFPRHFL